MFDIKVPGEFRAWFGNLFAPFPTSRMEIITVTAQKERRGRPLDRPRHLQRHRQVRGPRPQRRLGRARGLDLITIEDGQIVENNGYLNGADMARQLGALPPQGSVAEKAMTAALNAKVAAAKLIERARYSR